jgi:uncharacterized repeat protein (TIGR04138 family)
MMFVPLTDEDLLIIEPGVDPKAYRFVNMAINVMLASKIQRSSLLQEGKALNGFDLIQIIRYSGASFYGLLAPLVLQKWGITNDAVVYKIAVFLFILNHINTKDEIFNKSCYTVSRVLVPVESMDELTSFDSFFQQLGLGNSFLEA